MLLLSRIDDSMCPFEEASFVALVSRIDDSMCPFEEALFVALVIALPALLVLWVAVPEAGGLLEEMLLFFLMVI